MENLKYHNVMMRVAHVTPPGGGIGEIESEGPLQGQRCYVKAGTFGDDFSPLGEVVSAIVTENHNPAHSHTTPWFVAKIARVGGFSVTPDQLLGIVRSYADPVTPDDVLRDVCVTSPEVILATVVNGLNDLFRRGELSRIVFSTGRADVRPVLWFTDAASADDIDVICLNGEE